MLDRSMVHSILVSEVKDMKSDGLRALKASRFEKTRMPSPKVAFKLKHSIDKK
jgi:hypothetical protein